MFEVKSLTHTLDAVKMHQEEGNDEVKEINRISINNTFELNSDICKIVHSP